MSEASVKLLSRGVETLTDQELLELLLDDGDSERLAGALLSSFEGRLAALGYADIARLRMAAGMASNALPGFRRLSNWAGGCLLPGSWAPIRSVRATMWSEYSDPC